MSGQQNAPTAVRATTRIFSAGRLEIRSCFDPLSLRRTALDLPPAFPRPTENLMTHKTHSSWKKPGSPRVANWPAFHRAQQARAQQAIAEGQHRPAPSLEPPMTYDEHFDAKIAQIKADREEAEGGDAA